MEARVEDSDSFQRALGDALIAAGKLDKSGLERAARLADGRDERLANVLAKLGLVNERDLAAARILARAKGARGPWEPVAFGPYLALGLWIS